RRRVVRNVARHDRVLRAAQDERRDANRRQDVPHVDLLVLSRDLFQRAGAGAEAEQAAEGLGLRGLEAAEAADRLERALALAEDLQGTLDVALVLLLRLAPGVVGRPHAARETAADHEGRGAFRIGRR